MLLWDEEKIINRKEHWRISRLKEAGHILGPSDLLSSPRIFMNKIWERLIKKAQ